MKTVSTIVGLFAVICLLFVDTVSAKPAVIDLNIEALITQLSYDGQYLAAYNEYDTDKKSSRGHWIKEGKLTLYRLSPWAKIYTKLLGEACSAKSITIDRSNQFIAISNRNGYVDTFSLKTGNHLYQLLPSKKKVRTFALTEQGFKKGGKKYNAVMRAVFSPTEDKLLTANVNGKLAIWNSRTGELMKKVRGGLKGFDHGKFSDNGRYFSLTSVLSRKVKVWEVSTGKVINTYKSKITYKKFVFSPDNRSLMMIGHQKPSVVLWDFLDNKVRLELPSTINTTDAISSVNFIDKHHLVVSDTRGLIRLWNMKNHKEKNRITINFGTFDVLNVPVPNQVYDSQYSRPSQQLLVTSLLGNRRKMINLKDWLPQ